MLDGGNLGGLRVSRKIFVPETGGFARYLEVLTNPTTSARTVRVQVTGGIGNFSNFPQVVVQPDTTGNTYGVVKFAGAGSLGFVFAGADAAVPITGPVGVRSDVAFFYRWDVTVPAGQTVILMHFAQQDMTNASASTHAQELAALTRAGMGPCRFRKRPSSWR